ncbi:MAG TPA: tetratricopeptide repeat protein, partial [Thermoanaerobaculia bacterium]|nr:tetratricopeptide repeat protein [Thermoanaerobaculia bacterium]
MRRILLILAALASAPLAAAPRVSWMRTVPAAHDLGGADHIAVLYAVSDSDKVATFVDIFVDHANRSGMVHVDDVTNHGHHVIGERPDAEVRKRIKREHPADLYIGVNQFSCSSAEHGGEGSTRDVDGERVKRKQLWVDAVCRARVDIINREAQVRLLSFLVKGEGTSPRVQELGTEEREIALEQAARYAALQAVEMITPRQVRESVELDDSAPRFEEAAAMLDADRLHEVRALWEGALKTNPSSAALRYNLGALCEASGDLNAAREYYQQALRLSPAE